MNYEEFKAEIAENIRDYLPEEYVDSVVNIGRTVKNNDTVLDGLTVQLPETNVAPRIYLNGYFEQQENGRDMTDILAEIAGTIVETQPKQEVETSPFVTWEGAKDRVFARVCCEEENIQRLAELPHTVVEDLAVTYHVTFQKSESGLMSIPVHNGLLEKFGVTVDELHAVAMENMEKEGNVTFISMATYLHDMFAVGDMADAQMQEAGSPPLYILTNEMKINGAALIANDNIRQMIAEKLGGDYYVIPSSIHECMVMPKSAQADYNVLEAMVREVNETSVSLQEKLSDHVYEYDAQTHELLRCDHAAERRMEREAAGKEALEMESAGREGTKTEGRDSGRETSGAGERKPATGKETEKGREAKNQRPSLKEKLETKKAEVAETGKEKAPALEGKKKEPVLA